MKPNIYTIKGPWTGKLAILSRPRGNDWLKDEIKGIVQSGIEVVVSLLTQDENNDLGLNDEPLIVREHGLRFISFPINDYSVPFSPEAFFELVITLEDLLSRGNAIGIHCRQGIGRSSLLVACLLSLFNDSVDDCFQQIGNSRGAAVPDTAEQRDWVCTFARSFTSQRIHR